jgi:hypothetical protein
MQRLIQFNQSSEKDNEYGNVMGGSLVSRSPDALMSREELGALTGTKQPKRMSAWLDARGWAYEPTARRGDIPKVLRAYRDARLSGLQPDRTKRANYSFMTAGLL